MSPATLTKIGNALTVGLVVAYAICALLFAAGGLRWKALYFAGATVLTVGIWRMS